jgi:hypothetical protein
MTRAELMRHALSQALRRVHIGPKKLKLTGSPNPPASFWMRVLTRGPDGVVVGWSMVASNWIHFIALLKRESLA